MASENSQTIGRVVDVQVSGLVGAALDWSIAQVERVDVTVNGAFSEKVFIGSKNGFIKALYKPSADWSLGGPLIASHQINLEWDGVDGKALWWKATHQDIVQFQTGETPLIAACRAIVAAHLGEVVSVPAGLISPDAK